MNHLFGKISEAPVRALIAAAVSAAALLAGAPVRAQSLPITYPAPNSFYATGFYGSGGFCTGYCPATQSAAVADMNGDGNLDVVALSSDSYIDVSLGNGVGDFQLPVDTSIGAPNYHPGALVVGDFNGDHIPDVAVWASNATTGNDQVNIYLGNGKGGFTAGATYIAANSNDYAVNPTTLVTADINGDGILDLIALTPYDGAFVFLGVGDGTFQAAAAYATGAVSYSTGVSVADVNGDGKPDLVFAVDDGISVLLNTGNGTFGTATYYPSGIGYSQILDGIAVGNLGGSNGPDVVVTQSSGVAVVFLNQGGGTFAVGSTVSLPNVGGTSNLVLADINRDKILDLVAVDGFGNVFTYLGNGKGAFGAPSILPLAATTDSSPFLVEVADFNKDGAPDILDTNGIMTNTVSLGRGDGTFRGAQTYGYSATASSGHNIVTADFNGDGVPDVAYSWAIHGGTSTADFAIMLGGSHGVLGTPTYVTAGSCNQNLVNAIVTGDVNGDGIADIVATLVDSTATACQNNAVAVLFGKGDGKFGKPAYYATAATAQEGSVYLGDVSGDGKLDIVTENSDGSISVLVNQGKGTFLASPLITSTAALYRGDLNLALGDFNGDGKVDIAAAAADTGSEYTLTSFLLMLLSKGGGNFDAAVQIPTPFYVTAPVAADFNKDGKVDLVVAAPWACTRYLTSYAFLQGKGKGTFDVPTAPCTQPSLPGIPGAPVVADLNGDGNLDVVIPFTDPAGEGPMILQGHGDGKFNQPQSALPPPSAPNTLYANADSAAVADFNGDGAPDIVLLNNYNIGQGNNSYVDFVAELLNATFPVSVSPLALNFGAAALTSTKEKTVVLTNNQAKSLKNIAISVGGTDASDFHAGSTCSTERYAGWDCTITVTFTPGAAGPRTGTLSIADSVGTQTVTLSGTGE
jgi:hypothetical protein